MSADPYDARPEPSASGVDRHFEADVALDPDPVVTLDPDREVTPEVDLDVTPEVTPDVDTGFDPVARRDHARSPRLRPPSPRWGLVVLLLICLFAGWTAVQLQESGHDWGDDFSLYIRQAKAIVDGGVDTVISDTRYALDDSGWAFSPPIYPWGFPLLIAPVVAVFGIDYEWLKLLEVFTLVVAMMCLGTMIRRRLGLIPAAVGLAFLCCSQLFLGAAGSVLSDVPYLAWVMLTFVCIDWCRRREAFDGSDRLALITTGLVAAMAFSTRREGIFLLPAALAAQAVNLMPRPAPGGRLAISDWVGALRQIQWRRAHLVLTSFVGLVIGLQVFLPGKVFASYDHSSFANMRQNWFWFRQILAEYIGLKEIGNFPIELSGNTGAGKFALTLFFCAAAVGALVALFARFREDVHLVIYGACHLLLLGRLPFHEARYLLVPLFLCVYFILGLLPSALLLARQPASVPKLAVAVVLGLIGRVGIGDIPPVIDMMLLLYALFVLVPCFVGSLRSPAASHQRPAVESAPGRFRWSAKQTVALGAVTVLPAAALFATLGKANSDSLIHAVQYHRAYDYVLNGPTTPGATEMFTRIRALSRSDDVIAFFRARSMMLYTDRRAIQNSDLRRVATKADWYIMSRNTDGTPGSYGQYPLSDPEAAANGFIKEFENSEYVIWRTPFRRTEPQIVLSPPTTVPSTPSTIPSAPTASTPAPPPTSSPTAGSASTQVATAVTISPTPTPTPTSAPTPTPTGA